MSADTFTTYTGRRISVTRPRPEDIDIRDIAYALSRIQRYGGHCPRPCSVAEHSVLVSRLCRSENALLGLLHDASEAYVGDVISPLKRNLPDYQAIEEKWMSAIGRAAGLGDALVNLPADVHIADQVALQTERRDLFNDDRIDPDGPEPSLFFRAEGLLPPDALRLFADEFWLLTGIPIL